MSSVTEPPQAQQQQLESQQQVLSQPSSHQEPPVKVRKKPGRKPNPASPALRKAQNRAAQRAFRERKERHLRELELAVKQVREQRDRLQAENEQLKGDNDILRSENWYLKGTVLTLQLVCFRHNLVIPQHSPYINDEALSLLAQSTPEPIASYMAANANNKLPMPTAADVPRKPRDRYLSSGSLVVSPDGIRSIPAEPIHPPHSMMAQPARTTVDVSPPELSSPSFNEFHVSPADPPTEDLFHPFEQSNEEEEYESMAMSDEPPALSPILLEDADTAFFNPPRPASSSSHPPSSPPQYDPPQQQVLPSPQPALNNTDVATSNYAAVQILRLRLRLQSFCAKVDSSTFAIQPTVLQVYIAFARDGKIGKITSCLISSFFSSIAYDSSRPTYRFNPYSSHARPHDSVSRHV